MDENDVQRRNDEVAEWTNPKETATITRQQFNLLKLRDLAACLVEHLPEVVNLLGGSARWLKTCRLAVERSDVGPDINWPEELKDGEICYQDCRKAVIEACGKLAALALDTDRLMPDVGRQLRHSPLCKSGDLESDGFDLKPVLEELRNVRAEAFHRCGLSAADLQGPKRFLILDDAGRSNGEEYIPRLPAEMLPPKSTVSRPKLAQAAVIAHFIAHPNSQPTAEEIGKPVGLDAATIRNAPAWNLYKRGEKKSADDVGDAAIIGDVDSDLEHFTGRQERGRDRRNLRRKA